MARAVGLGKTSVLKIWREHGLKPHPVKTFKVSRKVSRRKKRNGPVLLSVAFKMAGFSASTSCQ